MTYFRKRDGNTASRTRWEQAVNAMGILRIDCASPAPKGAGLYSFVTLSMDALTVNRAYPSV